MDTQKMHDFITSRIQAVDAKEIDSNLSVDNGILLHLIPEELLEGQPIDWTDKNHNFQLKHAFRNFSGLDTTYRELGDKIVGYEPDREYFICYQNGIIEVFRGPIEHQNSLQRGIDYINVNSIFYAVKDFLKASTQLYNKVYNFTDRFYLFITLLNIPGTYFASFDSHYLTVVPFGGRNMRFEPFVLNQLIETKMSNIVAGVDYGIKSSSTWEVL